jgi:putative transposase
LGTYEHPVARSLAGKPGTGIDAECNECRQPNSQNGGKRGPRGYDGGKKIKGRKRHIAVDTEGFLLKVVVTAANVGEREGAKQLIEGFKEQFPRLKLLWVDGGYDGQPFADWVLDKLSCRVEITHPPAGSKGFVSVAFRWVVERTFAWLGKFRRLSKEYESLPESSESYIYAAMIHIMARRLAKQAPA